LSVALPGSMAGLITQHHPQWLDGTAQEVGGYFKICAFSYIPFAVMQAQCAIFRAVDKTRHVFLLWMIACCTEILLSNLFFLIGIHTLKLLAVSWIIGCSLACWTGSRLLKREMIDFRLIHYLAQLRRNLLPAMRSVATVGVPVAISELSVIAANSISLLLITELPQSNIVEAGWVIKCRAEEPAQIAPICAIAITAGTCMGRFSSRKSVRVAKLAGTSMLQSSLVIGLLMLVVAILFQALIGFLSPMLSADVRVQVYAVRFATAMAIGWPFLSIGQALLGALDGYGRPVLSTVVNICCNLPLRVFLALAMRHYLPQASICCVTVSGIISNIALAIIAILCFLFCTIVSEGQLAQTVKKLFFQKSYKLRTFPNDL